MLSRQAKVVTGPGAYERLRRECQRYCHTSYNNYFFSLLEDRSKRLRKYDHISSHRARLRWLPVESQIEYRSLCAIHRQYSSHQCVPLDPPIVFGTQHSYSTRSSEQFANIHCCRLTKTQRSFRYAAAMWWNKLSDDIAVTCFFWNSV